MPILQQFTQNPPLSLYIHIPWCVKKCPYCDFNSHVQSGFDEMEYVDCIIQDLEQDLALIWGRKIESIFIGGGTPSLFSTTAISVLLSRIRSLIPLIPDAEITLESNPGTVESDRYQGYLEAGVNRLSIGVQSFNDQALAKLGRIHDSAQCYRAIQLAHDAGFKQINLDLMYGLPEQTVDEARDDLLRAISADTQHLSWYQLTMEPNTVFYSRPPLLPEPDLMDQITDMGLEMLSNNGFHRYEVSAFAKNHSQCRHNLNYWQFGDYIGIGAGAHSKITHIPTARILRRQKTRLPQSFLDPSKPFCCDEKTIEVADLVQEFMLNVLRLPRGVEDRLFSERTGINLSLIQPVLNEVIQMNLIEPIEGRIQPTSRGFDFLNDTLSYFDAEKILQLLPSESIPIKQI